MRRARVSGWIWVVAALVGWLLFPGMLILLDGTWGFPLDDAWIYQTYGRSLATVGQFEFVPGKVSTGSTGPLWSLLVAVGYGVGIDYRLWTYLLGFLCLAGIGVLASRLTVYLFPDDPGLPLWVGLGCMLEWHMVWAAFSGMETALFVVISLGLLVGWMSRMRVALLGLLGGLLVLVRPEGIGLAVLVGAAEVLARGRSERKGRWLLDYLTGILVVVLPYMMFNFVTSGGRFFFPNTFYAKQDEVREVIAQAGIGERFWWMLRAMLIGPQALLVPGLCYGVYLLVRRVIRPAEATPADRLPRWQRSVVRLVPVVWWLGVVGVYAWRLPSPMQHGRYVMPVIPFLVMYGLWGTYRLLERMPEGKRWGWVARRVLFFSLLALWVGFLWLGSRAYRDDVAVINGEMVTVARWVNVHTPEDARIAAHDVGALGYFARRPLVDLAGLVSPEVIPFLRDEQRLLEFMFDQDVDYLVTFPSWYPEIVRDPRLELVYQTDCEVTRRLGSDNMAVYRLHREP